MPCGVKRILATELHRFSQKEIFTFSVIRPFGPEPFGNELKAELLTAEGCFLWPYIKSIWFQLVRIRQLVD